MTLYRDNVTVSGKQTPADVLGPDLSRIRVLWEAVAMQESDPILCDLIERIADLWREGMQGGDPPPPLSLSLSLDTGTILRLKDAGFSVEPQSALPSENKDRNLAANHTPLVSSSSASSPSSSSASSSSSSPPSAPILLHLGAFLDRRAELQEISDVTRDQAKAVLQAIFQEIRNTNELNFDAFVGERSLICSFRREGHQLHLVFFEEECEVAYENLHAEKGREETLPPRDEFALRISRDPSPSSRSPLPASLRAVLPFFSLPVEDEAKEKLA